jgi:predicted DNA repair protein MutK
VDLVQLEKDKIKGAVRTDFVLSAEIIVITLGMVASSPFVTQMFVLIAISLLMTVGVYGLVAAIVKLDDLGTRLIESGSAATEPTFKQRLGYGILAFAPKLMKFLSFAGTAAMFLVGGGILVHGIPVIHHAVQSVTHPIHEMESIGGFLSGLIEMILNGFVGVVGGAIVLLVISLIGRFRKSDRTSPLPTHGSS